MDEVLQVYLEQSEDVPVVRLVGELDIATAPVLRERLADLPAGGGQLLLTSPRSPSSTPRD